MATRTTKHLNGVAAPGLKTDDLLAIILKEKRTELDKVPEGFFTVAQWAKKWSLCPSRTKQLIVYALEKGLVERQKFRIETGFKTYLVPHYRELKKG